MQNYSKILRITKSGYAVNSFFVNTKARRRKDTKIRKPCMNGILFFVSSCLNKFPLRFFCTKRGIKHFYRALIPNGINNNEKTAPQKKN
jgi:hypothetical protein